eukprot:m.1416575 g.1416575  ORF g.1416575 m.1416575 type:complete len:64 (-) comp25029_c0_seq141:977-1168(-)
MGSHQPQFMFWQDYTPIISNEASIDGLDFAKSTQKRMGTPSVIRVDVVSNVNQASVAESGTIK